MAEAQGSSALFSQDGKLSAQELIPMALQHVVAAVVGIITPAIIVANLCHLPADQKTLLIQVSLVMSGLVTLVQAHPLFGGRFGSGLPVIMGTSFAYVPTLSAVGVQFGIGAILGAEIIGGAVAVMFAMFFRKIKSLFPSVVTGTVVLCIGISLYTVAVGYMAGGSGSSTFGSAQNWLVALVTLVACVYFSNFGKGVFKLGSLLFGMLVGYVLALALGMVSYDAVVASNWFELPHFMPFAIKFVPASIASITIVFIVASLETIGNFTGATVGGMDREPNVQELTGGLVSQGIMTMVGAFFGAMPTSSFGQNVGIVTQTRVINRRVFSTAAIILVAAGLMPKLAAVLSGIPQAVIGGATINVFGTISMTGIRMLTKDGLTPRRTSIAGLSVALGMGVSLTSGALTGPGMPGWVNQVFGGSAIVIAAITAIILNLVLPKGGPDQDVVEAVEGASEIANEGVSALYQSAATGVPAVEHVADADIHVATGSAGAAQDGEKNGNA